MGDWKGVRLNPGQPLELYNVAQDIPEKEDVSLKHPDIVKEIARLMDTCRTDSQDFRVSR